MRFTITTALFVLLVSTVFASPLPIDSSLEDRNVPAARSAAGNVGRRREPANLEFPNRKRKVEYANPDWKRAKAVTPDWKRTESSDPDWRRAESTNPDWKRAESTNPDWKRAESTNPDWKRAESTNPDWKRAESTNPDWRRAKVKDKTVVSDWSPDWKRDVNVAGPLS